MSRAEFPITPADVALLTADEFTSNLDMTSQPSLEVICSKFPEDTNRALAWWIRFRALAAWQARREVAEWLHGSAATRDDACRAAAGFALNDDWGFETQAFCAAVADVARERCRTGADRECQRPGNPVPPAR